ncbi:MAG: hypothetical protein AAGI71_15255 [Bacteroidota bacterium]
MDPLRINPLSRRPSAPRLVVAVRGAAGTGKSHFAASLAEAELGRLCFFDTERKARLLHGSDGSRFDGLEIRDPDELPAFIDWALDGEGQQQGYGCYALDSWAMYFGRKHRKMIQAVRDRTGDALAKPGPDDLEANQLVLQEVLRRLCVDSGACVVITDQTAAKGQQEELENQRGRVLPMTTGGLEYFVDVLLELSLRVEGYETVRVARVVKTNTPVFPVGLELVNPTFAELLARMQESGPVLGPPEVEPELAWLDDEPTPEVPQLTPEQRFVAEGERFGVQRHQLVLAARAYCGVDGLDQLTDTQVTSLIRRMHQRYAEVASGDGAAV